MTPEQLRNWFHEQMIEPEDNYSEKNGDPNYLCPAGRVQRGLPAFKKQKNWLDYAVPLEMSGMLWVPCQDSVRPKNMAYECRQPWLDKGARYTITHEDSPWVEWSATWWHGNGGTPLGCSGSSAELAAICKKHLDAMAAGAMKAAGVRA